MVKLENEYFIRFILLLIKGGTRVLRQLLCKHLQTKSLSIQQFLHDEKQTICKSKNFTKLHRDKLYPLSQTPDISTWDISLLSHILLLDFFGLSSSKQAAVEKIRNWRNQYQAHTSDASIEIRKYHTIWNDLTLAVTFLSHELYEADRIELMDLINSLASEDLDMNTSIAELKLLDRTDEFFESIQSSIENMERSIQQEVISCHQDVIALKHVVIPDLSAIKEELLEIRTRMIHTGEPTKYIYTVFGIVRVSALDQSTVDRAEHILLSASKDSLAGNTSPDDQKEVKECIDKLKKDIEENKDVRIDRVDKGSVVFTLTCSSLTGLLDVIDYFKDSNLKVLLADIEKIISSCCGQRVYLMAYLPDSPFLDIITKLKNIKVGALQFSMACTGPEGPIHAWNIFEEDTGSKILDQLSHSLSKTVGKPVTLTTCIEIPKEKEIG